ncbi:ferrochelatase [Hydrogenivirga sp. 128-5-R1-1]|uniref:ferrochelatase n=1 Tax=Hydrogenivirga sp. 128-5-R1-1 TaxID=392423 RepID=UPI00015EFA4B|nr:ferrochelatase [Hydrogenivirga sp. 128-5-R1-1]EDP75185.1 ferrochelatase [Hydrogenivirga sp. 128-5-R1-1]
MGKTGVILLNMGGPDSIEAIQPFLYNLFSDHDIIRIPRPIQKPVAWLISKVRAKKTRHYYEIMGGKSPQREQTEEQARKLQRLLGDSYRVVVAMRYWHPFTKEALESLFEEDIERIVLLPMYPQFSTTTTGSSFKEFYRVYRGSAYPQVPVSEVLSYHDHPLYIRAMVENVREHLPEWREYFFLFSAHSLPMYVIEEGDPYRDQTEETVRLIMEHFPGVEHALGYQSKVGPVKWLEPMTDKLIEELAKKGVKKLCVVPVSFVCEHSETLYELDVQYGELAKELGIESYVRIPTLRTNPTFIRALAELVLSAEREHALP